MHQISKISESASGALIRKKSNTPVNPFPEGAAVMKKAHSMGKHFSYSTRYDELMDICLQVSAARIRIKLDINGTRVTAMHGLLYSEIRLNKPLKIYQLNKQVDWKLSDEDWENIRDFEGLLVISDKPLKLLQHEIDLNAVTDSPRLPRINVSINEFSKVSRKCVECARLEAERRYCGNKGESPSWKEYEPSERELGATLLDLRTISGKHLSGDLRRSALDILRDEYIKYAIQESKFKKEKAEAKSGSGDDFDMGAWGVPLENDAAVENIVGNKNLFKESEEVWPEWVRYANSIDWKKIPDKIGNLSRKN
eukprot:IDg19558t1